MKKITLVLIFTFSLISNLFSEPIGYLICSLSINASNQQVFTWNVANNDTLVITQTDELWTSYDGVTAPPFIGNPCVIQDGVGNHITKLSFDGTKVIIPTDGDGTSADPGISFDGTKVVYVQQDVGVSLKDILHIVNYDGSGNTVIFTPPDRDITIMRPVFSPDGKTIAFSYYDPDMLYRYIYTISSSGGTTQELSQLPEDPMHPAYSPDGEKLAFVSPGSGGGTYHLYIANSDGSNPQQITSAGDAAYFPTFSPDGKYIAICSDNGISIIDLSNNQIIKEIPLDYNMYYGMVWCLGAQKSAGTIANAKIKEKALSLKIENMLPTSVPKFGYIQIDNTFFTLGDTNLWSDKKGRKYMYKDKVNKISAKITTKNKKGKFSAKKLNLTQGTDYRLNTNVNVVVNFGDRTIIESVHFDNKGKYKASK
ncbi:PD40 domain-containing protein [bacterium]|nr:PD40 domain-containing protein [bacterium]